MRTRKCNRGGGFFDFFRSKKKTPVLINPQVVEEPLKKLNYKPVKATEVINPLLTTTKGVNKAASIIPTNSSGKIVKQLETVIHSAAEILKTHPVGYLLVGTLLFIKKLRDLYKNHKYVVEFITQVETIVENSYRLNELIDKVNEMMIIYTFNNEAYITNYDRLFDLEKQILENKNNTVSQSLESEEKELFDSLLYTANNNKIKYRSEIKTIDFDNLDKFIEPNKLIKQQLTVRIAEINKYLLSIATNDMLNILKSDININKSGLIRLVLDEISSREKRRFKWLRNKKLYWYRANNLESIMRKLNDDLIMMNSLFILVKFQMDFNLEYYKNQNISTDEWNKLWKLITSFKEYTSYMIPSEVFMTINNLDDIIKSDISDSKEAVSALASAVNELNNEEEQEESALNKNVEDLNEGIDVVTGGGKNKHRRIKTRKIKKRKSYKKKNSKRLFY